MQHKELGRLVLEVAKRRLDDMLYVSLTEDHRESAIMFADVVGAQLISQLRGSCSGLQTAATNKSERSSLSDSEADDEYCQHGTLEFLKGNNEASKENVGHVLHAVSSTVQGNYILDNPYLSTAPLPGSESPLRILRKSRVVRSVKRFFSR